MIRTETEDRGMMDQVSITNLIDVLLVLLLIFMISARTFVHENKALALPGARNIQKPLGNQLEVTVTSGGMRIEGRDVDVKGLEERVRRMASLGGENRVVVRADGRVAYGRLMRVLEVIRKGGVDQVSLAVKGQGSSR